MSTLTQPRLQLPPLQLLSLVIPARDEEGCVAETVSVLHQVLHAHQVPHEIVVVDDGSRDGTWKVLEALQNAIPELHPVKNETSHGFGRAVQCGVEHARGDAVVIYMADASDTPDDVVTYWTLLNQGYECVFGSRFMRGSQVVGYPRMKLLLNRLANFFIKLLFRIPFNDTTNAFKAYRREVISGCGPILSPHFNITVELPLKAIVRGYSWTVTPIRWTNRKTGASKLKLEEMGSRYFFIVMYVWLEKYFSRGDYRREIHEAGGRSGFDSAR